MRYCPKLKLLNLPYGKLLKGTFLELRSILRPVRASVITSEREEDYGGEELDTNGEGEEEKKKMTKTRTKISTLNQTTVLLMRKKLLHSRRVMILFGICYSQRMVGSCLTVYQNQV